MDVTLLHAARERWKNTAAQDGAVLATREMFGVLWQFLRDSTLERRRQLYGDAGYDWDHRVNTTSAAVGWRDRLLGLFHSPYQPTEPELFHEMLDALQKAAKIDFRDYTFIDLGSGKGRTLLMASDYPFLRIIGVELLSSLNQTAKENLSKYQSESQKCFSLESICGDATQFELPAGPLVLYLFHPLPEAGLRRAIANMKQCLSTHPHPIRIIYHNPQLEHVFEKSAIVRKIGGTHQYSIYSSTS